MTYLIQTNDGGHIMTHDHLVLLARSCSYVSLGIPLLIREWFCLLGGLGTDSGASLTLTIDWLVVLVSCERDSVKLLSRSIILRFDSENVYNRYFKISPFGYPVTKYHATYTDYMTRCCIAAQPLMLLQTQIVKSICILQT